MIDSDVSDVMILDYGLRKRHLFQPLSVAGMCHVYMLTVAGTYSVQNPDDMKYFHMEAGGRVLEGEHTIDFPRRWNLTAQVLIAFWDDHVLHGFRFPRVSPVSVEELPTS